jgi:hypothetical protein
MKKVEESKENKLVDEAEAKVLVVKTELNEKLKKLRIRKVR